MLSAREASAARSPISRTTSNAPCSLIPYPQIDPVLIHLGPFAVRWYALAYIVGILLGWLYARRLIRNAAPLGGARRR